MEITIMSTAVPAVEVWEDGLLAGTVSVTLWRLSDGREDRVRGAIQRPVAGELTHIDYEVPLDTSVTYRAECFDTTGQQLGFTDGVETTVPGQGCWVHNPLDPLGGIRVDLLGRAAQDIQAPNLGEIYRIPGQRVGVFLAGAQAGLTGLDVSLATDSVADRDAMLEMLGRGSKDLPPILCFRPSGEYLVAIPKLLYAVVPNFSVQDVTVQLTGDGVTHFVGEGTEVAPPAPGLFVPLLTYSDVDAAYATYAALRADNLTYGSLNRRYDLATD